MDKQIAVYPDNGILLSTKKNELSSHEKTWRNLKSVSLSENKSEKTIYIDSNNMTFWKMQNYGASKKISDGQGLGGREG